MDLAESRGDSQWVLMHSVVQEQRGFGGNCGGQGEVLLWERYT